MLGHGNDYITIDEVKEERDREKNKFELVSETDSNDFSDVTSDRMSET